MEVNMLNCNIVEYVVDPEELFNAFVGSMHFYLSGISSRAMLTLPYSMNGTILLSIRLNDYFGVEIGCLLLNKLIPKMKISTKETVKSILKDKNEYIFSFNNSQIMAVIFL